MNFEEQVENASWELAQLSANLLDNGTKWSALLAASMGFLASLIAKVETETDEINRKEVLDDLELRIDEYKDYILSERNLH